MANSADDHPKDIATALAELWRAIASKLPALRDYDLVVLDNEGQHIQQMARKFFRRAARLRFLSILVLIGAFSIVVCGIFIFLKPTEFAEVGEVRRKVTDAQDQIRQVREVIAENVSSSARARDLQNLYGIFFELYKFLGNYREGESVLKGNPRFEVPLVSAIGAFQQLESSNPVEIEVDFRNYRYYSDGGAEAKIPAGVIMHGTNELKMKLVPMNVSMVLADLRSAIASDREASCVGNAREALKPFESLLTSAKAEVARLSKQTAELERQSRDTEAKILKASQTINESLFDANRPVSAFAGSDSWLPVLTVRVGVVVLMLYITKALLETYRYTITLASYYAARGDALQLLSRRPRGSVLDVKEFAMIVPVLSPDSYRIEPIIAPDDVLVRSVSAAKG